MSIEDKIHTEAVKKWGVPSQVGMMVEECGELLQALNKCYRKRGKKSQKTFVNVIEELVDVEIMIHQLKYIFNDTELYEKIKQYKLYNIAKRLDIEYTVDEQIIKDVSVLLTK